MHGSLFVGGGTGLFSAGPPAIILERVPYSPFHKPGHVPGFFMNEASDVQDDDELEYAIGSKMTWRRDGTDWVLFYDRRRMGRVVPDNIKGMCRSVKSGGRLSDMANLSWSKDSVMGDAIREITWEVRHGDARDPRKCPEKSGVEDR